jgi:hypothetical protein
MGTMRIAEELTNLGENMLASFDARVSFIGQNIADVEKLATDTHHLLGDFRKDHKTMAKKLHADLGAFVDDLTGTVDKMRSKFQKEQEEVHQDCKGVHQAWQKVSKAMAHKRDGADFSPRPKRKKS